LRMSMRLYNQYLATKISYSYIDFYQSIIIAGVTIIFAYAILKIEIKLNRRK